jgi:hypothetical protein
MLAAKVASERLLLRLDNNRQDFGHKSTISYQSEITWSVEYVNVLSLAWTLLNLGWMCNGWKR